MAAYPSYTLELLHLFFKEADELYSIFDKDLRFVEVNDAFLHTFRFNRKDVLGKHLVEVSPDVGEKGRYALYDEVVRTGETKTFDATLHPSLGKIHVRIKAFKVGDGVGVVMQNITDLRNAIDELDTISYRSSHDLSSPIATILGLVHLAEKDVTDAATARKYFGMIGDHAHEMKRLLQQLREAVRVRRGDAVVHVIDFEELCDKALSPLLEEYGWSPTQIERDIRVNGKYHGDRMLLGVIFENLVDNAIKYSKDNPRISISISGGDGDITMTIRDYGIGIPARFHPNVFEMFFRAEPGIKGAGLGLYTVKKAVDRLGGEVTFESKEGEGTSFTLRIPDLLQRLDA